RFRQDLLLETGELEAAAREYGGAPETSVGLYLKARVAPTSDAAVAGLGRAIELDPKFGRAYLESGEELVAMGRGEEGVKRVRECLELRGVAGRGERRQLWRAFAVGGLWRELADDLRKPRVSTEEVAALRAQGTMLVATGATDEEWWRWFGAVEAQN